MKSPQRCANPALPLLGVLGALVASCSGGGECDPLAAAPPPGTGPFGDFAFELRQDVYLGGGLVSTANWTDLDGDGLMDLAIASSYTSEVFVGRGLPDGTFITVAALATPASPWTIAAGDFDADGDLDLAVGCRSAATTLGAGDGQLALFLQDAEGAFVHAATTPLAGSPVDLHPLLGGGGDFDTTGEDLLVALDQPPVVQQLRFEGTAWSLMASLDGTTAGHGLGSPLSVATLDADADGDLDVAVGETNVDGLAPDRVVIYPNDGLGGFLPATVAFSPAAGPIVHSLGDVDGDGYDELGVAQMGTDFARLLRASDAGIQLADAVGFGARQSSVQWVDLDGDGHLDAAATLLDAQGIAVRHKDVDPSDGSESYGEATVYNVGFAPHGLEARVLPGDGLVDLVCANAGDVSLLHNRGDRLMLGARGALVGDRPQYLVAADFDADGFIDVVSVDQFQRRIAIMAGHGDGTFERVAAVPLAQASIETPGYLVARDFDEDGRIDLAATVYESGEVQLLRNPGSLAFTVPSAADRTAVGTHPLGIDAGDFDQDGHLDLLIANSDDQEVELLLGDGLGGFTSAFQLGVVGRALAVHVSDLDGDGDADAAVTISAPDGTAPRLVLLAGDGLGGLSIAGIQGLATISQSIAAGDLNLDGLPDLVFGQSTVFTDEVAILTNAGGMTFTKDTLAVGAWPGSLSIADVDADGDADLVIPVGSGELRLALGDGTGAFSEVVPLLGSPFTLPVPWGTNASAFADVDNDGLEDLLMISPFTPYLWAARNLGTLVP